MVPSRRSTASRSPFGKPGRTRSRHAAAVREYAKAASAGQNRPARLLRRRGIARCSRPLENRHGRSCHLARRCRGPQIAGEVPRFRLRARRRSGAAGIEVPRPSRNLVRVTGTAAPRLTPTPITYIGRRASRSMQGQGGVTLLRAPRSYRARWLALRSVDRTA
jgi:hypothetical protein